MSGKLTVLVKRVPDAHSWSITAGNLARRGKTDEALGMLTNVIERGKVPKTRMTAIYNTAIDICGHSGDHPKAFAMFNDVKTVCIQPLILSLDEEEGN